MISMLVGLGVSLVEKLAAAHFAKHGVKVQSAAKQSTAVAVIGDMLNASNSALPPGTTPIPLPANLTEIIDIAVELMKMFQPTPVA